MSLSDEPQKRCITCERVKPFSEFYLSKKNHDGRVGECIQCTKTRVNDRRKGVQPVVDTLSTEALTKNHPYPPYGLLIRSMKAKSEAMRDYFRGIVIDYYGPNATLYYEARIKRIGDKLLHARGFAEQKKLIEDDNYGRL